MSLEFVQVPLASPPTHLPTPDPILQETTNYLKVAKAWAQLSQHDVEKVIDLTGKVSGAADTALSCVYIPLKILGFVAGYFGHIPSWESLSLVAKLIVGPYSVFYFVLAAFKLIVESINLSRSWRLLRKIEGNEPFQVIETLRARFLSIEGKEAIAIETLAQNGCSSASSTELSEKVLKMKYEELETRVAPWCAEELKNSLNGPEQTALQTETLIKTVEIQVKKKILIQVLTILSILFFTVATLLAFIAISASGIPLALSIIGLLLFIVAKLAEKGALTQRGWNFSPLDCIPESLKKAFSSEGFKYQAKAF